MSRVSKPITATDDDIIILKKLSYGADATLALRARIILNCLEMTRNKDVALALSIDERSVALWKERFRKMGFLGYPETMAAVNPWTSTLRPLMLQLKLKPGIQWLDNQLPGKGTLRI